MLRAERHLSHSELLELLRYEASTGQFFWRVSTSDRISVGDVAGSARDGYRVIRIWRRLYRAHRLAWFYVHKKWPKNDIDHKNRIRDDNRIENLREATRSQNHMNRTVSDRNTSGFKGVSKNGDRLFMTRISINKVPTYIGTFETAEEAHAAYKAASIQHHKQFGRSK